jgi:SNF2 family DNA or RNA helicase
VAVPDVMAHGLTLTAASTVVWFTPHSRAEIYQQANGRVDRPGQKHPMEIINLYGSSEEKKVYEQLHLMIDSQQSNVDMYKELINAMETKNDD